MQGTQLLDVWICPLAEWPDINAMDVLSTEIFRKQFSGISSASLNLAPGSQ